MSRRKLIVSAAVVVVGVPAGLWLWLGGLWQTWAGSQTFSGSGGEFNLSTGRHGIFFSPPILPQKGAPPCTDYFEAIQLGFRLTHRASGRVVSIDEAGRTIGIIGVGDLMHEFSIDTPGAYVFTPEPGYTGRPVHMTVAPFSRARMIGGMFLFSFSGLAAVGIAAAAFLRKSAS
jgi:hypothetical protein